MIPGARPWASTWAEMELFDGVLDKYRKNEAQVHQLKVDRSVIHKTLAEKCVGRSSPNLSKIEKDAILKKFDEKNLVDLLRANCIRQARPWDAPGTDQEVMDEVIAQLELVTQASSQRPVEDAFLLIDYYIKLLRPYSQLWASPGVKEALLDAKKLVTKASEMIPEPKEDEWAHSFFNCGDMFGDKFAGSPVEKAIHQFISVCETMLDKIHKHEELCNKRDRDARLDDEALQRIAKSLKRNA